MVTQEYLKSIFHYDPETGIFTRLKKKGAEVAGTALYSVDDCGYLQVRIDFRLYRVHRLAWLYVYGAWPKVRTDHINTIKTDNRIANLREATVAENGMNRAKNKNNTTGYKGVVRRATKSGDRYIAQIMVGRKNKYLGIFGTVEEAHAAYCAAAATLHGEFARTA